MTMTQNLSDERDPFYMGAEDDSTCDHDWEYLDKPYDDVMKCAHCGLHQL